MNFKESIVSGLTNWKNFSGRASRSEFWYFYSLCAFIIFLLGLVEQFFLNISGWWQLSYITVIGVYVILVLLMLPAKEDENKWGRNPLLGQ